MSIVCITAEAGPGVEETTRLVAERLAFERIDQTRIDALLDEEFEGGIAGVAWRFAVESVIGRLAARNHLVLCFKGCERLFVQLDNVLRFRISREQAAAEPFALSCNPDRLTPDAMASAIVAVAPPESQRALVAVHPEGAKFVHPSEEVFANLLDFYRVPWEYEPRSFPLQWDKDGNVIEAFTPDFYLPEFDLYLEITTMKQALVTKKNRKVKLLKAIYPHINIQIFYQKDFQDLFEKYGIAEGA